MRLHEMLGGPEPDPEVENLLAQQRRDREEGADEGKCPRCRLFSVHDEDDLCPECICEVWEAREQDYYDARAKASYDEDMRDMRARGYSSDEIARGY